MNIIEALAAARAGNKVRHDSWEAGSYLWADACGTISLVTDLTVRTGGSRAWNLSNREIEGGWSIVPSRFTFAEVARLIHEGRKFRRYGQDESYFVDAKNRLVVVEDALAADWVEI